MMMTKKVGFTQQNNSTNNNNNFMTFFGSPNHQNNNNDIHHHQNFETLNDFAINNNQNNNSKSPSSASLAAAAAKKLAKLLNLPPFPQVIDSLVLPSLAPGNLVRWWRRTHAVLEHHQPQTQQQKQQQQNKTYDLHTRISGIINHNRNTSQQQQQQQHNYFQSGLAPTCICRILTVHMVQSATSVDLLHNSGSLVNGFTCPRFSLQDVVTGQVWRNLSIWPLDLERLE